MHGGTGGASQPAAPSSSAPSASNGYERPKANAQASAPAASSSTGAAAAAVRGVASGPRAAARSTPAAPSTRREAMPTWDDLPGSNADVLRLALSRLDIDVALSEILHFLTSDERLPGRTRKAVQFLQVCRATPLARGSWLVW